MDELRLYFGFRSPYSRLGLHKIANADISNKVSIRLIPFTGLPEGVPFFDPLDSPPKLAYYAEDAPRMTRRAGLAITAPDPFEVPMSRANKAFFAANQLGKGMAFALAVSDARWGAGKNISDLAILSQCAQQVGLPADLPKQAKNDPALIPYLDEATQLCHADHVFGVPFAVLDDGTKVQKFWGQDRFDLLLEILAEKDPTDKDEPL
ncbi:MAG: DsbA family protein [bacterium]